jgi:hypothetical protein
MTVKTKTMTVRIGRLVEITLTELHFKAGFRTIVVLSLLAAAIVLG